MPIMKTLILRVTETGNKAAKFKYEAVSEDGKVLTSRNSNRVYVACYVVKHNTKWDNEKREIVGCDEYYSSPFYFGRLDLVGKGDSRHLKSEEIYGLAKIK